MTIACAYDVATTDIRGGIVSFNATAHTIAGSMSSGALEGSGNFTITSEFIWTGGAMSGSGTTFLPAFTQLLIQGNDPLSLSLDRRLDNQGDITWSGLGGGTLSGSGIIDNGGTFTKTDNSTAVIDPAFNNEGVLDVQQGALQLGGGGVISASSTLSIAAAATLAFSGGTFSIYVPLNTMGTVVFSGGDILVSGAVAVGTLEITGGLVDFVTDVTTLDGLMSGGVFDAGGDFTITHEFCWSGGTIRGTAVITVAVDATLTIDDDGDGMVLDGTLDNHGTIRTEGVGTVTAGTNALINNAGTFSVEGDSMTVAVPFNNTGTVSVQNGDLTLQGGGQGTGGAFQVSDNGSLTFKSDYTLDAASSVSSPSGQTHAVVFFSSGTVTVGCAMNIYQITIDGG